MQKLSIVIIFHRRNIGLSPKRSLIFQPVKSPTEQLPETIFCLFVCFYLLIFLNLRRLVRGQLGHNLLFLELLFYCLGRVSIESFQFPRLCSIKQNFKYLCSTKHQHQFVPHVNLLNDIAFSLKLFCAVNLNQHI